MFLGHCDPRVTEAVCRQASTGVTYGSSHHWEYEVAELLVDLLDGVERLLWSNTGTEAVMSALRLARAATGREKIVKCTGHYHGWQDAVLVNYRGPGADRTSALVPGTRGQSAATMGSTLVAEYDNLDSAAQLLAGNDVAVLIVEPILMNSGVLQPAGDYLAGLRELCDRAGTVLIFDEVITGVRLGLHGAQRRTGVQPDLSVYAKALANGFPVAAIAGRADLIDQVTQGVVHAGTYNGNPVSLSATNATLRALLADDPYDQVARLAERMVAGFNEAMRSAGIRGTAHAVGSVAQVALGIDRLAGFHDYLAADWGRYDALLVELLRRNQFALPGGRWYLTAAHTPEQVDQTVAAFAAALEAVAAAD
ncbi:MAG: aminotransferase class III-fold pyridoxal phosphate-dependent enzyme [Brooklawnia sp.]|uniref:aspartate aminotransferase family protein n=1 Tax=Brooklawnia sp. TaxID=2699740 RepID=UPI003C777333